MKPTFAFRCPKCGATTESTSQQKPICTCGAMMRRDYRAEAATPLCHPTKGK